MFTCCARASWHSEEQDAEQDGKVRNAWTQTGPEGEGITSAPGASVRRRAGRWSLRRRSPDSAPRRDRVPQKARLRCRWSRPERWLRHGGQVRWFGRADSTRVMMIDETAGASARSIDSTSLSRIAANTNGLGVGSVRRCCASASAPAALCAASSNTVRPSASCRCCKRPGQRTVASACVIASGPMRTPLASSCSSRRTAMTALVTWWLPASARCIAP